MRTLLSRSRRRARRHPHANNPLGVGTHTQAGDRDHPALFDQTVPLRRDDGVGWLTTVLSCPQRRSGGRRSGDRLSAKGSSEFKVDVCSRQACPIIGPSVNSRASCPKSPPPGRGKQGPLRWKERWVPWPACAGHAKRGERGVRRRSRPGPAGPPRTQERRRGVARPAAAGARGGRPERPWAGPGVPGLA
jgi:hypothetical protein